MITDWLMVGITAAYVVATVFIWRANSKSAEATEKQVAESRRQYEERKRIELMPYLQITLDKHKEFDDADYSLAISSQKGDAQTVLDLKVQIENIGLGTAKDFRFRWTNVDNSYPSRQLPFSACLPGEEKNILIDFYFEHYPEKPLYDAEVSIQLQFRDLLENKYEQTIVLLFHVSGSDQVKLIKHTINPPSLVDK